ncbi:DUF2079 domain-containing protein, partial [Patescibacteria group bacterium]|nr:DUF2079 domain-containing protein [Patescibacteria group bacterium]
LYGEVSRFSIHADTMLILLAPLYWIVASPYVLLAVQVLAVAAGAIGIYLIGKAALHHRGLALLSAFTYLMFPPLQYAVGSEFHSETVTTSCLIFAFYFLYTRRYWPFAVFALLSLTGKETMAFMVAMLGIYALWTKRDWRVGLATIGISGVWFYVLLWYLMPSARSDGAAHFALSYYSQFGGTPAQIFSTLVLKPWTWIANLLRPDQALYLFYFFLPTALLPLLSPLIFLLALPELMLNMLSNDPAMHSIQFQYTSSIIPFACIAMVFGLARLRAWIAPHLGSRTVPILVVYCLIGLAIGTWVWSPLPGMREANLTPFTTHLPAGKDLDKLSRSLPKNASVSTTDHLSPHFSERENIYPFPQGIGDADYLIIKDDDDPLGFSSWDAMQQQILELRTDPRYNRIYQYGTVEVYQKVGAAS